MLLSGWRLPCPGRDISPLSPPRVLKPSCALCLCPSFASPSKPLQLGPRASQAGPESRINSFNLHLPSLLPCCCVLSKCSPSRNLPSLNLRWTCVPLCFQAGMLTEGFLFLDVTSSSKPRHPPLHVGPRALDVCYCFHESKLLDRVNEQAVGAHCWMSHVRVKFHGLYWTCCCWMHRGCV
ncbi:hypothetical protein LR48_Vigan05g121800 [Vigna angularis]|uniref:Uncharacterized protein n=3 Tax=Phaseolus angularis TaxID=3914 RepID=A0A0L9ULI7_PHAAN|nr:hypothetical protein LR48_Vigan05g121800 [Vigna angularis]BAT92555.1 hypothetical protein VIGAN_07130400 [Vigna angularis var. angularis]